jgi:hypothetical protein
MPLAITVHLHSFLLGFYRGGIVDCSLFTETALPMPEYKVSVSVCVYVCWSVCVCVCVCVCSFSLYLYVLSLTYLHATHPPPTTHYASTLPTSRR